MLVSVITLLVEDWTWPFQWEAYHNVYISTLDMVGIGGNRVLQQHAGDLPGIEANLGANLLNFITSLCTLPGCQPQRPGMEIPTLRLAYCQIHRQVQGSTWRGLARLQHKKTQKGSNDDRVPKKTQFLFVESQ